MSASEYSDLSAKPIRELRRLNHSNVVATTYVKRVIQDGSDPIETRAAEALRDGYEDGYENGYAEGVAKATLEAALAREEYSKRASLAFSALSRALQDVYVGECTLRSEVQAEVPKLVFRLLEQLFARELELAINPGREAVARALALDDGIQSVTIRMNPKDITTLGEISSITFGREVNVVGDVSIELGGALVEIGRATFDAQMTTALDRVRRVLLGHGETGIDK